MFVTRMVDIDNSKCCGVGYAFEIGNVAQIPAIPAWSYIYPNIHRLTKIYLQINTVLSQLKSTRRNLSFMLNQNVKPIRTSM